MSQPTITVRCSTPKYDPITKIYSVDVDFKSDIPNQKLYGMNVRFFYDSAVLKFKTFGDFAAGYGKYPPNPPRTAVYSGDWFGFNGAATYINGAVAVKYRSKAPVIPVDNWVKLFNLQFDVVSPASNFCPSIVWDKLSTPESVGFIIGSSGVCITLTGNTDWASISTLELVEQFNWTYGNPTDPNIPPFGHPVLINCVKI